MQIDLLVNALSNDMTRVATLQYMRSVGQAQMRWLGIEERPPLLSHDPMATRSPSPSCKRSNVVCG